jgi:hypothetical protein
MAVKLKTTILTGTIADAISAGFGELQSLVGNFDDELTQEKAEAQDNLQSCIDSLDEIIGEAESVEFPGMFG